MPTSEPMTMGEIARALSRIEQGTASLHDKLDARPTWTDIERLEKARDNCVADLRAEVDELQANQRKVAWAIVGAVLVAVTSLVVGVPPAL